VADCAASPALFYADIVAPFSGSYPQLTAYFERLLDRPSFRRVLSEARPYFHMFPFKDAMPARFLQEP
jgi:glutathione S-transferase